MNALTGLLSDWEAGPRGGGGGEVGVGGAPLVRGGPEGGASRVQGVEVEGPSRQGDGRGAWSRAFSKSGWQHGQGGPRANGRISVGTAG